MPEIPSQLFNLPRSLALNAVRPRPLSTTDLKAALHYIDDFWPQLTRTNHNDRGTLIGLPHPYIVPSIGHETFQFQEQYYWDSYFTALGLVATGHGRLALGMLENLLYLFERFGMIPNASRLYMTSRSQPPLLTSYIRLMYDHQLINKRRLQSMLLVAEREYHQVWMGTAHPHWRKVHAGLSRYYDINMLHDMAEAESGWDMTTRFNRCALDYLPVDLNALLYKYETDFAWAAGLRGDAPAAQRWQAAADGRAETMNRLMYSKAWGTYFDYNFARRRRGSVWSLASFYPLWAGMASPAQAARLALSIVNFEQKGGLSTTLKTLVDLSFFGVKSIPVQWAYPNGWAPLHYFVIEGLRRYGFDEAAERLTTRWLEANLAWFKRHGVFTEKYNVVTPGKMQREGVYPQQTGFGWTNGVFAHFAQAYIGK